MAKYINLDDFLIELNNPSIYGLNNGVYSITAEEINDFVMEQPTIDAVQVVRCGECTRQCKNTWPGGKIFCHGDEMRPDDFCSKGKRKAIAKNATPTKDGATDG